MNMKDTSRGLIVADEKSTLALKVIKVKGGALAWGRSLSIFWHIFDIFNLKSNRDQVSRV